MADSTEGSEVRIRRVWIHEDGCATSDEFGAHAIEEPEGPTAYLEAAPVIEALKRYGVHETGCSSLRTRATDEDCDCGLRIALHLSEEKP